LLPVVIIEILKRSFQKNFGQIPLKRIALIIGQKLFQISYSAPSCQFMYSVVPLVSLSVGQFVHWSVGQLVS